MMNFDYVIVDVNGVFANIYDFCTPETAGKVIRKATEQAEKEVKDYDKLILDYQDGADYWESCRETIRDGKI